MTESDWGSAAWLGSGQERQFRVEFALPADARVSRARLHVDAPGCAVTFINGNLVGPASGNCPWTQFSQTVLFTTRDATAAVQPGKNAIGIVLGHGTFHHSTGSPPRLRAMLFVTMRDGTTRSLVTTGGAPLPPPPPPPPPPGAFCGSANEHAVLTLACQSPTQTIKSVTFASFGTPTGTCVDPGTSSNNSFAADPQCNANVEAYVGQACIGKHSCTLSPQCKMRKCVITPSGPSVADPCRMQKKHLDVAVKCGGPDRRVGAAAAAAAAGTAWSASQGPIISDDPWLGTTTNWTVQAGNAAAKWTEPGFDAASAVQPWIPAGTAAPVNPVHPRRSAGSLLTQDVQRIPAEAAWSGDNDSCIVKFPENFVGVVAVQIPGYVAITGAGNITLRHSEVLMPGNKSVDLDYSWGNQDTHIFSDAKIEPLAELRPRFTWHGFQFVQVQAAGSVSVKCAKEAFVGVNTITPLRSVGSVYFDEKSGGPAPMLNQLQSMVVKGQASNVAAGMPTDCPTREKHGWLGDAQVTVDEAMYNFDMAAVYTEFLNTIRDNQKADGDVPGVVPVPGKHQRASSATAAAVPSYGGMFAESALEIGSGSLKKGPFTDISWSSAYPLIADAMFKYYGDLRVVQRHWSTMDTFMQGLLNGAANGACAGGLPSFFTWGDWCATEPRSKDTKDTGAELAAANYIFSMDAMANMASALGKGAEAAAYAANATRLRSVFHSVFYNNQTKSYAPNNATLQTLAAASLALGGSAIPGELHTSVAASLNQNVVDLGYHHTVGAVGAKLLLPQLSANGFAETAMKVATQTTFPSFGYWMSQGTTCWENWSGVPDPTHPPPPTHNHIFLCGGLGKWLYQSIGGIAPGDHTNAGNGGGYENVMINPDVTVSGPASSSTLIDTVRGKVFYLHPKDFDNSHQNPIGFENSHRLYTSPMIRVYMLIWFSSLTLAISPK